MKGEISGSFRNAILGLCQTSAEFDANELRKAMKVQGVKVTVHLTQEICLDVFCEFEFFKLFIMLFFKNSLRKLVSNVACRNIAKMYS